MIVKGPEPHLRWRTYTDAMVELVELLGVELVITLGAYLSEVTHGRQVVNPRVNELLGMASAAPAGERR